MKNRMVYQNILLATTERVSTLTINRPDKRNALNQATRDEILHALDSLESAADSRVLVITGAGDKAFVAGADIGEFEGRDAAEAKAIGLVNDVVRAAERSARVSAIASRIAEKSPVALRM